MYHNKNKYNYVFFLLDKMSNFKKTIKGMSQEQGHENPQLISYNLLRQLIGILGII